MKKINKNLIQKLLEKLTYGNNTRSINLNANPGTSNTKLDIEQINEFTDGFTKEFIKCLLTKSNFEYKFEIKSPELNDIQGDSISEKENSIERKKQKGKQMNTIKRLDRIIYDVDDFKLETGTDTFGFGFPIISKKANDKEQYIQSPLFIWNLQISKIRGKKNCYVISKTDDNYLGLNEALLGYLRKDDNIDIPQLDEDILDDGIIDEDEMVLIINGFFSKFGINININKEDILNITTFLDKEIINQNATNKPTILFHGTFGMYKNPKQAIIKDTQNLLENYENIIENIDEDKEIKNINYKHNYGALLTDPSQQLILNKLGQSKYKIIQGPPGTGKSRTLTSIITNALDNGKKVLVVCEKITALEVLKNNLEELGLGDLSIVIDDIRKDRKNVVHYVRNRIEQPENNILSDNSYNNNLYTINDLTKKIQQKYQYQNKLILGNNNIKNIIGKIIKLSNNESDYREGYKFIKGLNINFDFSENELGKMKDNINKASELYSNIINNDFFSYINIEEILNKGNSKLKLILEEEIEFIQNNTNKYNIQLKLLNENIKKIKEFLNELLNIINNNYFLFEEDKSNIQNAISQYLKKIEKFESTEKLVKNQNILIESFKLLGNQLKIIIDKSYSYFNSINTNLDKIKTIIIDSNNDLNKYDNYHTIFGNLLVRTGSIFSSKYKQIRENIINFQKLIDELNDLIIGDNINLNIIENKWSSIINKIDSFEKSYNELQNNNKNIFKNINQIFENIKETQKEIIKKNNNILSLFKENQESNITILKNDVTLNNFVEIFEKIIKEYNTEKDNLLIFFNWTKFFNNLEDKQKIVIENITQVEDKEIWEKLFLLGYYQKCLIKNDDCISLNTNEELNKLFNLIKEFNGEQIKNITNEYNTNISKKMNEFSHTNNFTLKQLYNKRGTRGQRRNSLRKIVEKDSMLFKSFFPVILTNPDVVCSIFPLERNVFDLVIFDEASQLRLEDTLTSFIRGKEIIISGDSQQMPPSNYFQSSNYDDELDTDATTEDIIERNRTSQESLLEFGNDEGFENYNLTFHYRSKHPSLIEFSNHGFYDSKLYVMPNMKDYKAINYINIKGTYDSISRVNYEEANHIIDLLIKIGERNEIPSILVATFNIQQRNLIKDKINEIKEKDKKKEQIFIKLEGEGLVIRNLENIQGDEKDILIISTTFGRQKDGSFRQSFGRINTGDGYRYLNVLISRAKKEKHIVTSIPNDKITSYNSEIELHGNIGKGIFYAYLHYCKSVSEGNQESIDSILKIISNGRSEIDYQNFIKNKEGFITESPFEEEILEFLLKYIDKENIETQYKCGTFRLDFVAKAKDNSLIVIECDGATFHSSELDYWNDKFRQNILENHGFKFIRIWSTDWREDKKNEIKRIEGLLKKYNLI